MAAPAFDEIFGRPGGFPDAASSTSPAPYDADGADLFAQSLFPERAASRELARHRSSCATAGASPRRLLGRRRRPTSTTGATCSTSRPAAARGAVAPGRGVLGARPRLPRRRRLDAARRRRRRQRLPVVHPRARTAARCSPTSTSRRRSRGARPRARRPVDTGDGGRRAAQGRRRVVPPPPDAALLAAEHHRPRSRGPTPTSSRPAPVKRERPADDRGSPRVRGAATSTS